MSERPQDGAAAFFRRYTKSWYHAIATAGLTGFGMLTFVHWGFAVVAVGAYALPPVLLYRRNAFEEPDAGVEQPAEPGSGAGRGESTGDVDSDAAGRDGDRRHTGRDGGQDPADRDVPDDGGATGSGDVDAGAPDAGAPDAESAEPDAGDSTWTSVEASTAADLFDAVVADGAGYAVGEGGVVLTDGGEEQWRTALSDGPAAAGSDLTGVDATADGEAVWVAGDEGALGRLAADAGRHVDHSAPMGRTDAWTDIAVSDAAGRETLLLVNSSGEVVRGTYRGGDVAWEEPSKPGSGSSLAGASLTDEDRGVVCDTNDGVFEVRDDGSRRIGLDEAPGTLTGVAASEDGCAVVDDDGVYHRYDGANWTPERLETDSLAAVDRRDGREVAAGDDGVVFDRSDAAGWSRRRTTATSLNGVAVGDRRAVAVGSDGTVLASDE
jgi:hypothetical protein